MTIACRMPAVGLGLVAAALLLCGRAAAGAAEPPKGPEAGGPAPRAPEMPPLLAWWKLDEGQGETVADASGHGLTGTLRGAKSRPVWIRTPAGAALSFGGVDGCVEFKTTLADLKVPFAISFCVKPAAKQVDHADILGNHGEPFAGLCIQQDGGKVNSFGCGYGDGKQWQGAKPVQLKADVWQHVAVVCDGENAVFYVNGEEKTRNPAKGPFKANPNLTFKLGQGYAAGRFLNGALCDVRIHGGTLSPAAVAELAKAAKPLTDAPGPAAPPETKPPETKPPDTRKPGEEGDF